MMMTTIDNDYDLQMSALKRKSQEISEIFRMHLNEISRQKILIKKLMLKIESLMVANKEEITFLKKERKKDAEQAEVRLTRNKLFDTRKNADENNALKLQIKSLQEQFSKQTESFNKLKSNSDIDRNVLLAENAKIRERIPILVEQRDMLEKVGKNLNRQIEKLTNEDYSFKNRYYQEIQKHKSTKESLDKILAEKNNTFIDGDFDFTLGSGKHFQQENQEPPKTNPKVIKVRRQRSFSALQIPNSPRRKAIDFPLPTNFHLKFFQKSNPGGLQGTNYTPTNSPNKHFIIDNTTPENFSNRPKSGIVAPKLLSIDVNRSYHNMLGQLQK